MQNEFNGFLVSVDDFTYFKSIWWGRKMIFRHIYTFSSLSS